MDYYTDEDFVNLDCFFNNNNSSADNISLHDYNSLTSIDEQTFITNTSCGEFSTDNFKFNTTLSACDGDHSYDSMFILEDPSVFGQNHLSSCKLEQEINPSDFYVCPEKEKQSKAKSKVSNGRPSKNLMAERRRRKRLNDRLSMLRSVVPKISKMDRTSILGDTIDYMKELLGRISNLQEEIDVGSDQLMSNVKTNEQVRVRNSPKFDVERRKEDTRIEICCAARPSLLLSTVTTLEALGLEIQHCVISCFNDFALQASCFEEMKLGAILDAEDVKEALFRNAEYGGIN